MAVVANEQHVTWEKRGENWVQNTSSGGGVSITVNGITEKKCRAEQ